ncbi:Sulfotransferase 1C4 [Eumeta japonica]|uniref:Sulfotransferase 1C4 n=1 Tax=Eumeta variegata TaxID=151549 RepID=A0A4C1UNH6_EUMVA|nr:Sulfotransferase 1C4 [Eumeta japonica]
MAENVKVLDVEADVEKKLATHFGGPKRAYAYFGEDKYFIPKTYKNHADGIRRMPLREDDIWVATFPRSGTTWTQEMVWLINNKLNYEKAADSRLMQRYIFLEFRSFLTQEIIDELYSNQAESHSVFVDYKSLVNAASPRFFKTHLPMPLLPAQLLDTARVVYVARDPRDVAVSYYHHNKLFKVFGFTGDFKDYWEFFKNNQVEHAPFFAHVKGAWAQRNHPNMLFLFYEEMYKDLPSVVRRVAKFFEKQYSDEQLDKLCEHLTFDNMKQNAAVHPKWLRESADGAKVEKFFRKGANARALSNPREVTRTLPAFKDEIRYLMEEEVGHQKSYSLDETQQRIPLFQVCKSGGWRDYFDDKMAEEAEDWIQSNLRDTDLRFPEV